MSPNELITQHLPKLKKPPSNDLRGGFICHNSLDGIVAKALSHRYELLAAGWVNGNN